jgi:hypothetical protein
MTEPLAATERGRLRAYKGVISLRFDFNVKTHIKNTYFTYCLKTFGVVNKVSDKKAPL